VGQFDFTNFSTQVHDFDPGIVPYPNGIFWTVPISRSSVQVNLGAGRASYRVSNLALRDYDDLIDAIFVPGAPYASASVSFDVEWSGAVNRIQVTEPSLSVRATLVENSATMTWTATTGGVTFVSDPANMSSSVFALIGRERNGVFF
jgi:hypothetical protein